MWAVTSKRDSNIYRQNAEKNTKTKVDNPKRDRQELEQLMQFINMNDKQRGIQIQQTATNVEFGKTF